MVCGLLLITLLGSAKNPIRVACVGNSVTFGYGLDNRETHCYPYVLQQLLGKPYEVRNFGHSGTTLLSKGHRPYIQQPEYQEALAFKPDFVVIHLGLNDTDPRNWPNYNSEFDYDYQQLINSFRQANPKAQIWLCLMTPIFHPHPRFESGTRNWHAAIQKHIRRIAKANQTGLIDLHTPLYSRPDLFADALHPNTEGAAIMAKTIYAALTGNYDGLKLAPLYGDGMVMQRQQPIVFRGTANAGTQVKVAFNGQQQTGIAAADGHWKVTFPAMEAGGPYEAQIRTKGERRDLHLIYIGEVWLCSGQSNMEFPVRATTTSSEDLAHADQQPLLHLYNMPTRFPTNAEKWPKAVLDSINRLAVLDTKGWQVANKATVASFSAVAYHFGKALADSLKVPVGIICNAVGGTTTESWIDRHTLEWQFPSILYDWYHGDFGQPWARKRALENIALAEKTATQRHPYEPCYMFEAGILPLKGYAIKGVAWYQGESNAHNIELHARLFR
ncbi:MAG: sialate O-acetylesterase, partial [Prevotella sp.]|nr:sialate O-acetylesterase [Prevotella sp.]